MFFVLLQQIVLVAVLLGLVYPMQWKAKQKENI